MGRSGPGYLLVVLALLFSTGCGGSGASGADSAAAVVPEKIRVAIATAAISRAIEAMPTRTDSILSANSFTAEAYERHLLLIAADSQASKAYADALRPTPLLAP
jgi:hypothetical protein